MGPEGRGVEAICSSSSRASFIDSLGLSPLRLGFDVEGGLSCVEYGCMILRQRHCIISEDSTSLDR